MLDNNNVTNAYSLGANLQPSQALCAFNTVTLGAAWGLAEPSIEQYARETCSNLLLQRDSDGFPSLENALHNERSVLTFLEKSYYYGWDRKGPEQLTSHFVNSLSSKQIGNTKQSNTIVQDLASINTSNVDWKIIRDYNNEQYVDFLGILKVVLSNHFVIEFASWSKDDFLPEQQSSDFDESTSEDVSHIDNMLNSLHNSSNPLDTQGEFYLDNLIDSLSDNQEEYSLVNASSLTVDDLIPNYLTPSEDELFVRY
jgi:hypothetical protein